MKDILSVSDLLHTMGFRFICTANVTIIFSRDGEMEREEGSRVKGRERLILFFIHVCELTLARITLQ